MRETWFKANFHCRRLGYEWMALASRLADYPIDSRDWVIDRAEPVASGATTAASEGHARISRQVQRLRCDIAKLEHNGPYHGIVWLNRRP